MPSSRADQPDLPQPGLASPPLHPEAAAFDLRDGCGCLEQVDGRNRRTVSLIRVVAPAPPQPSETIGICVPSHARPTPLPSPAANEVNGAAFGCQARFGGPRVGGGRRRPGSAWTWCTRALDCRGPRARGPFDHYDDLSPVRAEQTSTLTAGSRLPDRSQPECRRARRNGSRLDPSGLSREVGHSDGKGRRRFR